MFFLLVMDCYNLQTSIFDGKNVGSKDVLTPWAPFDPLDPQRNTNPWYYYICGLWYKADAITMRTRDR